MHVMHTYTIHNLPSTSYHPMSSASLLLRPSPGTSGRLATLRSSRVLGRAHRPHGTEELFAVVPRFRWEVNRELEEGNRY